MELLSYTDFFDHYGENIFSNIESAVVHACHIGNMEIINWFDFIDKNDLSYCKFYIMDIAKIGNITVLEWLYSKDTDLFDNYPFIKNNILNNYHVKILKMFLQDNFNNICGSAIEQQDINKIYNVYSQLNENIKYNMNNIVLNTCKISDIELLKYMCSNNYTTEEYILSCINNIDIFNKNRILDWVNDSTFGIDKLKL